MRCVPHQSRVVLLGASISMLAAGCQMTIDDVTPAARAAIESRFPKAAVQEVEGKFGGLYEIELSDEGVSREVKLHQDGTVIEIETMIAASDLPEPVAAAAAKKSGGAELKEIEKVELLAKPTAGKYAPLAEPTVFYEVAWMASGFEQEIEIDPDGTIR